MTVRFERYVAIGDSSTEGLEDPDGAGGYRGWANRLAERVAEVQGGLLYANLGVRGKRAINEALVAHGKAVCRPIGPKCGECPVSGQCARVGVAK